MLQGGLNRIGTVISWAEPASSALALKNERCSGALHPTPCGSRWKRIGKIMNSGDRSNAYFLTTNRVSALCRGLAAVDGSCTWAKTTSGSPRSFGRASFRPEASTFCCSTRSATTTSTCGSKPPASTGEPVFAARQVCVRHRRSQRLTGFAARSAGRSTAALRAS